MKLQFLRARGTGEVLNAPMNFLTQFCRDVCREAPDVFDMGEDLEYPASITAFNPEQDIQGVSLKESKLAGVVNLISYLSKNKGEFILLGYSLGGIVVTEAINILTKERRWDLLAKVKGVVLVANPLRNPGDSFFKRNAPGYGLYGKHDTNWPDFIPVWEIANPVDGITCTSEDSPLRWLPDGLDAFSFAVGGGWGEDLLSRLRTARWQLWGRKWYENPIRVFQRWSEAIGLVDGYLRTDQHNGEYWRGGYMDEALDALLDEFVNTHEA